MTNQAGEKTENSLRKVMNFFSKPRKQTSYSQSSNTGLGLRKSRSLTSATFLVDGLEPGNVSSPRNYSRSTSSRTTNDLNQQSSCLSRSRAPTPERQSKSQQLDVAASLNARGTERPTSSGSSRNHNDSSGSSSNCSSNNTIDRYIDVEQAPQQERSKLNSSCKKNRVGNGSGGYVRLPPRAQHPATNSPTDRDKPRSYSFKEVKGTRRHFSSRDWMENGFANESPRKLAKNVMERLSQSHLPKTSSLDSNDPITIGDVYAARSSDFDSNPDDFPGHKSYSMDDPYETVNEYDGDDFSSFKKPNCFAGNNNEALKPFEIEEQLDMELHVRSKEAEERVMLLSAELERGIFLQDGAFDVPALIQTVRNLMEEKMQLALQVSGLLQTQMVERASAKEELKLAKAELESQTHRFDQEKNDDSDRKSSEWSFKVERYKQEEQRLRERVRELAEQNVSLQREVSSLRERDAESSSMVKYSGQQVKDLGGRVEELSRENQALCQTLPQLEDKYRAADEDRDCMKINLEEKGRECRELHKSIARLLRACTDQEKTIDGLREGLGEEIGKKQSLETCNKYASKLQTEQMRLIGVELALRREVESYRLEADSLRRENINLLDRLKGNSKERAALTFRLDKEMWTRICCLQSQGLSILNESSQVSSKLLEFIKGKSGNQEIKHGIEAIKDGLDGQFIIESEIKVQGFKRGTESLTRSLQRISALLHEKCNPVALKSLPCHINSNGPGQLNDLTSEDIIKSELKAESLLTNVLREKLYSKELEVEQLQAELATAVRGNDILRFEVQNSLDNLSCVTHKLKDLELEMLKKDEKVRQVESSLQEYDKELAVIRGILPKVSQERDVMWEEVKQYSEKNMLLNSEVNVLRKRIEALDEDVLIREGQISILKDTLGGSTSSFDLLGSPDNRLEFRMNTYKI